MRKFLNGFVSSGYIKLPFCMCNDELFKMQCMVLLTFGGFSVIFCGFLKIQHNILQKISILNHKLRYLTVNTQCRFQICYFMIAQRQTCKLKKVLTKFHDFEPGGHSGPVCSVQKRFYNFRIFINVIRKTTLKLKNVYRLKFMFVATILLEFKDENNFISKITGKYQKKS